MGIESTRYITREDAIDRIKGIAKLFIERDYREIETRSFDPDVNLQKSVDNWIPIDTDNIENWTDEMLADYMDEPFFRYSMFSNYLIGEEE